mmetsp:Transcript_11477/g.27248  ORF Transcript_11477/g.27248 Transcript_11477/m.27248 type:complete len:315 (+) Transcript_11477:183-1127(+)
MIAAIVIMTEQNINAPRAFANVASVDWAATEPFNEKTENFFDLLEQAVSIVQRADTMRTAAFWVLILCCIRVILYLKIHPHIAGVTRTFELCAWELVNFLISFSIIYFLLAFIAFIKFGYQYDEFATMEDALLTQFSILIGGDAPDYRDNPSLCIYVVGYVFVCTLSLLNFLLAIVVAGYDKVREQLASKQVVTSFVHDALYVVVDSYKWFSRKWPSKVKILNALTDCFPEVMNPDCERTLSQTDFAAVLTDASIRGCSVENARDIFQHYARFEFIKATENLPGPHSPPEEEFRRNSVSRNPLGSLSSPQQAAK